MQARHLRGDIRGGRRLTASLLLALCMGASSCPTATETSPGCWEWSSEPYCTDSCWWVQEGKDGCLHQRRPDALEWSHPDWEPTPRTYRRAYDCLEACFPDWLEWP